MMDKIIIGAPHCGSTSLTSYLEKLYPKRVLRTEIIDFDNPVKQLGLMGEIDEIHIIVRDDSHNDKIKEIEKNYKVVVWRLEDISKKKGFPHLNKHG